MAHARPAERTPGRPQGTVEHMFGDAVRDLLDPRLRGGAGRLGREPPKKA